MWGVLNIAFITGTLFAIALVGCDAAHAASIWGSGDPIIINVQTGDKNYSNHTQWVSSIFIDVPTKEEYGYGGCGKFEVWTQNFYVTKEACGPQYFYISKSVSTGNGVCAAFKPVDYNGKAWNNGKGWAVWQRSVACISIKV